jgi:acetoin utilization protein AcuC
MGGMSATPQRPILIGSDLYRRSTYGGRHPLAIPRVWPVIDLARAMGWLPDAQYRDSPQATPAQLVRFHDPAYIEALQQAEATQRIAPDDSERFNLGRNGNRVHRFMFRRPATACGATLLAADLLRDGGVVHSPAGGTHHGQPDRASGFCYLNDPALGILAMLDGGLRRVLYVDIDAHHGDGVQDAFADDDRVLTISVHEAGRWPGTGAADDVAGGLARNVPVPPGFNDIEMAYVLEAAILPLAAAFAPDAVVLQCGADGLADDPMSRLELSNGAHAGVVAALRSVAPRLLLLGGGGYNPWATARCWTRLWATLNDIPLAPGDRLPAAAESVLRGLFWQHSRGRNPPEHWFTTLADPAHEGPAREEVRSLVRNVMSRPLPQAGVSMAEAD